MESSISAIDPWVCHMRNIVASLILFSLTCAGCSNQPTPPKKESPLVASLPTSVLEVPPKKMRQALVDAYRLRPDKRVLFAIARIHHFLSGQEMEHATVEYQDERWQIRYRNTGVGSLPEFPGFSDLLGLLSRWVKLLNQQYPLKFDVAETSLSQTEIERQLDRFLAPHAAAALRHTEHEWNKGSRSPTLLRSATRALVFLNVQALDSLNVAETLPANALALLALTKTLTSHKLIREECMLAYRMGYSSHAVNLAAKLPQSEAVRLYVTNDDKRLTEAASKRDGTVEARYLWLLRLSEMRNREGLFKWWEEGFPHSDLSLPFIKAALLLGEFDLNRRFSAALPHLVLLELARETGARNFDERFGKLLARFLGDDSDRGVYEAIRLIRHRLGSKTSSLMNRFETDLEVLERQTGPFLYPESYATYFRGHFYSGLYTLGLHYMYQLSSVPAVKEFAEDLEGARIGTAADFQRWYSHLAQFKKGDADPRILLDDLATIRFLGGAPLKRTLDELKKRIRYSDPMLFAAAKLFTSRLDTRPAHRLYLAGIAHGGLFDLKLTQNLYASGLKGTAIYKEPRIRVWYANFTGNQKELRNLLHSPYVRIGARVKILGYLEKQNSMQPSALQKEYRRLIDEDPDNWGIRRKYIDYLKQIKKYSEARSVITDWLNRHGGSAGFDYIYARTQLAHIYELEGRYEEGWTAVEPVLRSWHASPMRRAAFLLERMGLQKQAEEMAGALVSRYPDDIRTRIVQAELYWRHRKYDEAARALRSSRYGIGLADWRFQVGPKFGEVFSQQPKEEALAAFSALLAQGFDHRGLRSLAFPLAEAGRYGLAFDMASQLHWDGLETLVFDIDAYRYLKPLKGRKFAVEWLRRNIPPDMLNHACIPFYHENELDLLWDIIQDPDERADADCVWLMRAAASVRLGPDDPHRKALMRYFSKPGSGHYHALGQYLMGIMSEEDILALATNPKKRCEIAYFLGLRAHAEGRYEDASDWFRVTVETGQNDNGEYHWAYSTLQLWQSIGKSLPRIAADARGKSIINSHGQRPWNP